MDYFNKSFQHLHLLFFLLFCSPLISFGQNYKNEYRATIKKDKPILDSMAIDTWPTMRSNVLLSNDGNFFKYVITRGASEKYYTIISATNLTWKEEFSELDYKPVIFTKDSKQFIFKHKDTLCFLNLQSKNINKITNVNLAKNPEKDLGQWIAYLSKDSCQTLIVSNLINGKEYQFTNIVNFYFDKSGNSILLLSKTNDEKSPKNILKFIDLATSVCTEIWNGPINMVNNNFFIGADFSQDGSQLAFLVRHDDKPLQYNDLWYFKKGMTKAMLKACNSSAGIKTGLQIFNSMPRFLACWCNIRQPMGMFTIIKHLPRKPTRRARWWQWRRIC